MKILFFGTPRIAVPFLLKAAEKHSVVGVITQPDKPASRHYLLHSPEAKLAAIEKKLPVFQPEKFDDEIIKMIKELNPDLGIVVSYGKLIPEKVFRLPKLGCFNIHFSLLPKYRGAAPVQWSLINGEKETGVTSFWIEKTLDTGPILLQKGVKIENNDDSEMLFNKLIPVGLNVMNETIALLKNGKIPGIPQNGKASYAPVLKKDDGKINWLKPANEIINLIKGTFPWPGAFAIGTDGKLKDKRLKVIKAELVSLQFTGREGEIIEIIKNSGFIVACGHNSILVKEVQPENKRSMDAWAFLQGGYAAVGSKFS